MRILQINQHHYPRGGADIVYLNHIDLLKKNGHDVAEFSAKNEKNNESKYSDFFVDSPDLRKSSFFQRINHVIPYIYNKNASENIKKLIDYFKPDIAHIHLFNATLSISILKTLFEKKIPILHTIHDYKILCPVNTMLDSANSLCNDCVGNSVIACIKKKCSDDNLAQSIMVAAEGAIWRKILPPSSFISYYHFVSDFCMSEHLKYHPEISDRSSRVYNYSPTQCIPNKLNVDKYFLYFGRLSHEKGIKTLMKSWRKLPHSYKLLIVGDGYLKNDLLEFKRLSNLDNVELLGYKRGEDLYELVSNAFFVIIPSEWFENNPMTIIESYKFGVPVIGASIGGIPEIIKQGETGFIFESGNFEHLAEIINKAAVIDEKKYSQMRNKCIEFFDANFSENIYYKSIMEIYEKTISIGSVAQIDKLRSDPLRK